MLTGPSGCGKSTLLRLIAGLEVPHRGTIRINGAIATQDARIAMGPPHSGLSMVFQDLGLWPNLTTIENILLGLAGTRLSRREKLDRAHAAMVSCQITSKADELPCRLSVGEQQRAALARAVAVRPKLLLLDEPFTGLDITLRDSLFEQVNALIRHSNTTIVMVSHLLFDAPRLSADLAVLEDGCIREFGPFEELLRQPQSRTLSAWAKAIPCPPANGRESHSPGIVQPTGEFSVGNSHPASNGRTTPPFSN